MSVDVAATPEVIPQLDPTPGGPTSSDPPSTSPDSGPPPSSDPPPPSSDPPAPPAEPAPPSEPSPPPPSEPPAPPSEPSPLPPSSSDPPAPPSGEPAPPPEPSPPLPSSDAHPSSPNTHPTISPPPASSPPSGSLSAIEQKEQQVEALQQKLQQLEHVLQASLSDRALLQERVLQLQSVPGVSNTNFPINRVFFKPSDKIVDEMEQAQRGVEEAYRSAGSLCVPARLLDSDSTFEFVDDGRDSAVLTVEEFCARYKPLVQNPEVIKDIKKHIKVLKGTNDKPGLKVIAINALNGIFGLSKLRTCVILCGNQSSGKTTLLECLIGCRLGFSQSDRATVCPVVYIFEYAEGEQGYFQTGNSELTLLQSGKRSLTELPNFVKNHMTAIAESPQKISKHELFVRVVSGSLGYSGVIVDCPGTLPDPKGAKNALEEERFTKDVQDIISRQIQQANINNSVILCVEYMKSDLVEGGCGNFYNKILSETPGFNGYNGFKDRVKIIITHNDFGIRGNVAEDNWMEEFNQFDNEDGCKSKYKIIKDQFFETERKKDDIFFVCMKHVDRLYAKAPPTAKLEELRKELLMNNSLQLINFMEAKLPQLAHQLNVKHRFNFENFRNAVFTEIELSSEAIARRTLDAISGFVNAIKKRLAEVKQQADEDSHNTNSHLVQTAWNNFEHAFSSLAQEYNQSFSGLPNVNLHFDKDEFSENYHRLFPLQLTANWPRHIRTESPSQPLERFAKIHKFEFHSVGYDEMQIILQTFVDGHNMDSASLAGAYEAMIDRLMCRLATVQLRFVAESEIANLLNSDPNLLGKATSPAQAAFRKAMQILELLYIPFLEYFQQILVHFFHRAIDYSLYNLRIASMPTTPYVAKYKQPLAALRNLLYSAVTEWAKKQVKDFYDRLPLFTTPGDDVIEQQYRAFTEQVHGITTANNNTPLADAASKAIRDLLIQTFSKQTLTTVSANKTFNVKDLSLVDAKPLQITLQIFAYHHAKIIRRFGEEFRYRQYKQIFGNNKNTLTRNHLKSMMEGFVRFCVVELQHDSFEYPPDQQTSESLVFRERLGRKELEKYLEEVYGITDDTARGSHKRAEMLGRLLDVVQQAVTPINPVNVVD